MKVHFTKMHGAGNDYIYIDCCSEASVRAVLCSEAAGGSAFSLEALAQRLSDRHFGIGADGLVLILPSEVADLRMRMFNADGSEAQMFGNAARCVARYAYDHKLVNKETFTLETLAGIKTLRVETPYIASLLEPFLVSVDMGEPELINKDLTALIATVETRQWCVSSKAVSMGNPHAVFFVPNLNEIDVHGLGAAIEHDPLFPERTNVEFVEIISPTEVRMRVWERGSGETLACGTGACAVCVAGATLGLTERNITLHLLGGDLQVNWQPNNHVLFTGPAEYAFTGEVEI